MADEKEDIDFGEPEFYDSGFDNIDVHMSIVDLPSFKLTFSVTPSALERAKFLDPEFEPPKEETLLAHYLAADKKLILHPTVTSPDSKRFLQRKHPLDTITLEGFDDVVFVENGGGNIEDLPDGFIRNAHQGFGVIPNIGLIVQTIARIPGVTDLTLTDEDEEQKVVGNSYRLSYNEFERMRLAIGRANAAARKAANKEKSVFLRNCLLSPIDSEMYPPAPAPFQKEALQRAAGQSVSSPGRLMSADRKAVVEIVKSEARTIAQQDETELLELNREIEVVTLEVVTEKMTKMMERSLSEATWQKFLSENPFILRLAFGLPIMVFGEQVSVGGIRFDNKGGKLADFIVKSGTFGNLAIIEIKRPDTVLIENKHYRGSVHAPTKCLAGGVNQVIDQRYMLAREIDIRKNNSHEHDVWSYAVKCYVIAGRTITDPDKFLQEAKRKSFEFYRHSLIDVTVITFDELLEKLKALLAFLTQTEDGKP